MKQTIPQPGITGTFTLSPNAKELTPDILIRTLFGKSEAASIEDLRLYGDKAIDDLLAKKKASRAAATV